MAAKIFDNDAMIRYSVELLMQKKGKKRKFLVLPTARSILQVLCRFQGVYFGKCQYDGLLQIERITLSTHAH